MTNREFFTQIMNAEVSEELKAHAEAEIAKLDKRNANRSSKPNKKQIENEPIKAEIVELLEEKGAMLSATIATVLSTEERPISTSKVGALCRQLVANGVLTETEVKVPKVGTRKQYAIAVQDENAVQE